MDTIISHKLGHEAYDVSKFEKRIKGLKNPHLPIEDELIFLKQLQEFPLGQFLLNNQGLNGYWTDYIIFKGYGRPHQHPLENFLLNNCPGFLATQERFKIFQEAIIQNINSGDAVASIPCGLMSDFLNLDYQEKIPSNIYGVDLDQSSLNCIRDNRKNDININLIQENAWDLKFNDFFNLVVSNGLNIYEKDFERLIELYKIFHRSLKKNGVLVTSFLTPPPTIDSKSPWKNYNHQHLTTQRAIFEDILNVKWVNFETEETIEKKMNLVGFEIMKIHYDYQGMFPTIILKKI